MSGATFASNPAAEPPSPAPPSAGQCYRVSLERARSQRKTAIELRAAMGLYRLLRRRGTDAAEARETLQATYAKFTEGFDTPDLCAARALLEEP